MNWIKDDLVQAKSVNTRKE